MSPHEEKIQRTTQRIIKMVKDDDSIGHCRINIINGKKEVFNKYKEVLNEIQCDLISVRFYNSHDELQEDLFNDPLFMSPDWFNLFVFNLGKNGKAMRQEMVGVEVVTHELQKKFDSKYYSTLIVSDIAPEKISEKFESETGEKCPISNKRYLHYDFSALEILEYLNKILHTHSNQFLSKWADALKKLESLQEQPLKVSNL